MDAIECERLPLQYALTGNYLAYWIVVYFSVYGQSAYTLQTEIICAMNYACIYVQINSPNGIS